MDVRYSDEQRALRDAAVQVVDRLGPRAVGELDDAERVAKLDAAVASSGWRELRTPDDEGAPWASAVEVAIVAEELARGRADVAFLGPTLAAELRRYAGAPEAATRETVAFRPDLAAPAEVGRGAAGDAPADDGAVAVDAAGAEHALVLAAIHDGWALATVAVPAARTGVDITRPTVPLRTTNATTVADQTRALDADDLAHFAALGLATTSADLVGSMQGALDLSVEYARQRQQYGRPIGSFQAVQHLLADAAVHLEGSRTAALHAAWAVDALAPADALAAASSAKAYASRAARAVGEIAIQVHGGIGNTWECLAHVHLRRALLATDLFGGVGVNLARVLQHAGIGGGDGLR
jgi:alkylation response protein AidB-like acyl-CoA dehydrogenase